MGLEIVKQNISDLSCGVNVLIFSAFAELAYFWVLPETSCTKKLLAREITFLFFVVVSIFVWGTQPVTNS